jgi:putative transposase
MKGSRFTESQIFEILKESEAGTKTGELCRKHSISAATLYKWRSKFGGMTLSDLKKLKELEQENSKLKHLLAEALLDIQALKLINSKKY